MEIGLLIAALVGIAYCAVVMTRLVKLVKECKRLRELEHTHILDTQAISNLTVALEKLVRDDT